MIMIKSYRTKKGLNQQNLIIQSFLLYEASYVPASFVFHRLKSNHWKKEISCKNCTYYESGCIHSPQKRYVRWCSDDEVSECEDWGADWKQSCTKVKAIAKSRKSGWWRTLITSIYKHIKQMVVSVRSIILRGWSEPLIESDLWLALITDILIL